MVHLRLQVLAWSLQGPSLSFGVLAERPYDGPIVISRPQEHVRCLLASISLRRPLRLRLAHRCRGPRMICRLQRGTCAAHLVRWSCRSSDRLASSMCWPCWVSEDLVAANGPRQNVWLHLNGRQLEFFIKVPGDHMLFFMKGSISDRTWWPH